MKYFLLCLLFFLSVMGRASSQEQDSFDQLMVQIKGISAEKFPQDIAGIKNKFENFFENNSRICKGEFSTMVLAEGTQEVRVGSSHAKLSREEVRACLNKLTNLRIEYIQALYQARERYLKHLHLLQLQELKDGLENEISRWQKLKTKK